MSKRLERYIREENYHAPDDEIRELCKNGISIWYGFDTYQNSVKHIHELCEAIRSEYPDAKDEDMEVWFVEPHQSIRHARFTTLRVKIPTEDFIRLRQERKIGIL